LIVNGLEIANNIGIGARVAMVVGVWVVRNEERGSLDDYRLSKHKI
jgi:hypothetical protein